MGWIRHNKKTGKGSRSFTPRNYSTYLFKQKNKILHGGITEDLKQREKEHQQKWPRGHIVKVGRVKTKEAALKWEKEKGFS